MTPKSSHSCFACASLKWTLGKERSLVLCMHGLLTQEGKGQEYWLLY